MKTIQKLAVMILALLLSYSVAFSSDFTVNTKKGDVQIKKGSAWVSLAKGDELNKGDQIKIGKKSYLSLVYSNGNPIELKKSGNYSVSKLIAKANRKKSNVTRKFTKFILDELGGSEDLLSAGNLKDNMATLGAVERAMDNKFSKNNIDARLPRSSYTTSKVMEFSWYPEKNISEYTFFIKNPDDEIIYSTKIKGSSISVNLDDAKIAKGECFYWGISSGKKASEEFCIYRLEGKDLEAFNTDLSLIKQELGSDEENEGGSSINNLILASFYAENKMVDKACSSYAKAIELSPDVENFKAIYAKYLVSIGLNKEAEYIVTDITGI